MRHYYNISLHCEYLGDLPETPNHFCYELPGTARPFTIVFKMSPRRRQRSCYFHLQRRHGGDNRVHRNIIRYLKQYSLIYV